MLIRQSEMLVVTDTTGSCATRNDGFILYMPEDVAFIFGTITHFLVACMSSLRPYLSASNMPTSSLLRLA